MERLTWRNKPRRPGGGRKPRYGSAMISLAVRVPPEVKAALVTEYGSVQAAVDVLIIEPLLEMIKSEGDRRPR